MLAKMSLTMYAGDRLVKVGEAVANPIKGTSGTLSGCGLAVALLKTYMQSTISRVEQVPGLSACKYVDDVKIWARGNFG